ncbi:MAG: aldehyde ferredoxin oxidoreductase N-terminal domain-containing protein [Bacillota bacterium]
MESLLPQIPGGSFGPELKNAGWDGIIFEGKAEKPVYLWINNDQTELRCAKDIWGKSVIETTDWLKENTKEEAKGGLYRAGGRKFGKVRRNFE